MIVHVIDHKIPLPLSTCNRSQDPTIPKHLECLSRGSIFWESCSNRVIVIDCRGFCAFIEAFAFMCRLYFFPSLQNRSFNFDDPQSNRDSGK